MIPTAIREARDRRGLTLEQLSRLTGIAAPNLSRLERGQVDARMTTVARVLDALELKLDIAPLEQDTLDDVREQMSLGAERLRRMGITSRNNPARLRWKEQRGLDTTVERRVLGLDG